MMVELIHVRSKNHGVELTPLNICWIEGERAIFARKKVRRGRGGALSSLNRACIAMLHSNRNRLVPSLVEFPPPAGGNRRLRVSRFRSRMAHFAKLTGCFRLFPLRKLFVFERSPSQFPAKEGKCRWFEVNARTKRSRRSPIKRFRSRWQSKEAL